MIPYCSRKYHRRSFDLTPPPPPQKKIPLTFQLWFILSFKILGFENPTPP